MSLNNPARHRLNRFGLLVALPLVAAMLCAPAIVVRAADDSEATQTAANSEADSDSRVYPRVYKVEDLAVWRVTPGTKMRKKELDCSILVALIKSAVDPESWEEKATLSVYAGNLSMVVSQTEANHRKISDLLESLRMAAARR